MSDHEAKHREKSVELANTAVEAILRGADQLGYSLAPGQAENLAGEVVAQLASITLPEPKQDLYREVELPEGGSGQGPITSVKPGNILLNMGELLVAISGGILTFAGVLTVPWLAVFAAIVVWDSLWKAATVQLSEQDAAVLWTLWKHRDPRLCAEEPGLLGKVNAERRAFGSAELSEQELNRAIDNLLKINTIERSASDLDKWCIKEWIRIQYSE